MRVSTRPVATPSALAGRSLNIVMTDDDPTDRFLVETALGEMAEPINFSTVENGADLIVRLAAAAHAADLPDLIVLDLQMPGFDGLRTLDQLQSHPVLWRIPVIVFTSSAESANRALSFERGARWVEAKPLDFDGMLEFARLVVERASVVPQDLEPLDDGEVERTLDLLRADTLSDLEDELLIDVDAEIRLRA